MQQHTIQITRRCEISYFGIFGTNLNDPIRLLPKDYFTELPNGRWRLTQVTKPAWKETVFNDIEFSHGEMEGFCGLNRGYFKDEKDSDELEFEPQITTGYTGSSYEKN